jgi:hypothetical protein
VLLGIAQHSLFLLAFSHRLNVLILRELDASGVSEASPRQSDREGTELSVSKAVKLLLVVELEPLYRKEVVSVIAARRKKLPSEQDDVVEQTDNRLVTSYMSDTEAVPAGVTHAHSHG